MRRVEVRCCCSPLKLLGTLPMPENATRFNFVVMPPASMMAPPLGRYMRAQKAPAYQYLTLEFSEWFAGSMSGYALKADGVPIETLRRIPGFIEAKE